VLMGVRGYKIHKVVKSGREGQSIHAWALSGGGYRGTGSGQEGKKMRWKGGGGSVLICLQFAPPLPITISLISPSPPPIHHDATTSPAVVVGGWWTAMANTRRH